MRVNELEELALLIKASQRELERRTNEAMRPLGLSAAQADAVAVIAQTEPLSLKELGGLLIAESGHPSRLVDRLVDAGVVERRPDEQDRRQVVLHLTERGRRLSAEVAEARAELFALAESLLGGRDVSATVELLREMTRFSSYAELVERRRALAEDREG